MFEDVLRFWLDRGVDGFRVDVAHGLFKEEGLRDQVSTRRRRSRRPRGTSPTTDRSMVARELEDEPMWDQPEVHDVYRTLAPSPRRSTTATGWPSPRPGPRRPSRRPRYVRPDELHQAFNFAWLLADWVGRGVSPTSSPAPSRRRRAGRRLADLGAQQPRRRPPRHAVRRRRGRPGPGPRGDPGDARAARLGVPLPGRGARPRAGRRGPGGPAGPVVVPHRRGRAATAAGCRCRGAAASRRTASGRAPAQPWIPQPADWAPSPSRRRQGDSDSTLEFYRARPPLRREFATDAPAHEVELLDLGAARAGLPTRAADRRSLNCGVSAGAAARRRAAARERAGRRSPAAARHRRVAALLTVLRLT